MALPDIDSIPRTKLHRLLHRCCTCGNDVVTTYDPRAFPRDNFMLEAWKHGLERGFCYMPCNKCEGENVKHDLLRFIVGEVQEEEGE